MWKSISKEERDSYTSIKLDLPYFANTPGERLSTTWSPRDMFPWQKSHPRVRSPRGCKGVPWRPQRQPPPGRGSCQFSPAVLSQAVRKRKCHKKECHIYRMERTNTRPARRKAVLLYTRVLPRVCVMACQIKWIPNHAFPRARGRGGLLIWYAKIVVIWDTAHIDIVNMCRCIHACRCASSVSLRSLVITFFPFNDDAWGNNNGKDRRVAAARGYFHRASLETLPTSFSFSLLLFHRRTIGKLHAHYAPLGRILALARHGLVASGSLYRKRIISERNR